LQPVSATVAVVGRGFGARVHAPGWELAGAHVVGVAGRDDWQALLECADVVSVATPPAAHAEIALAALARGKAVLCEKPLAATLGDAELLATAGQGYATAVNFSYRAIPGFERFRELLDGRRELEVLWTAGSRAGPRPPSWKDDPLQGGALSAYGVHAVDYARWLLGEARVEAATIELNGDAFTAVLAHERGRSRLNVSLVADARVHRLEAGELVLENVHPTDPVGAFTLRRGGNEVAIPRARHRAPKGSDPRVAPFAAHARALLDGEERPTFTDGLHAQRLLDEIRRIGS
jgi:predicted dehydrogenase